MIPEELAAVATVAPVILVLWLWLISLQNQVRELREQRDRWISEYLSHLRSSYNMAVEMELKKSNYEQTDLK